MSAPAVLIATARVRAGEEEAFAAWQARHTAVISKFVGFISSDMVPPSKSGDEWTILLNFETPESLDVWRKSPERAQIAGEIIPMLEGGDFGETLQTDQPGEQPGSSVTEVVFSKVRSGMADKYRDWAARIQAAQARYPGYRGTYLQPPAGGKDGHWTTIIRYDTAANLESWMNSPERKTLLAESKQFIESEELMRLATAFPGWVPIDPMTGEGPPNWKTAMLVLLGLFPIVMLEMRFLSPVLATLGMHASLATFIGNAISVALTSFFTMPWCVGWFGWWLFPKGDSAAVTSRGVMILTGLYALEVFALWWLLPW